MAIRYVDTALATGSNDGTSWANAWRAITSLNANPGDTIYISGGASGGTRTINMAGEFTALLGYSNGTSGNPVTYQIGQDSAHNGTVIFNRTSGGTQWLFGAISYVIFSGDAGDGGRHFKLAGYGSGITIPNAHDTRISYVDFDQISRMGDINPCGVNVEIDHCYCYINDIGSDHLLYAACATSSYDGALKIHHCDLNVPYNTPIDGIGTDCLQLTGEGWSVYENTITGYAAPGASGNHQDGIQSVSGAYIRIYNNVFKDMKNYAIYLEPAQGGYAHVRVHGNRAIMTSGQGSQIAYAVAARHGLGYNFDDGVVANNVADGYPSQALTFNDPFAGSGSGTFTNCICSNNVSVTGSFTIDAAITAANNSVINTTQAAADFTSYTAGSLNNDYSLKSGSALIGIGSNLTSYFTVAANGTWPAVGAWDGGAYYYSGGGGGGGTITCAALSCTSLTIG